MEFINPRKLFTGAFVPNWLMERTELSQGAKLCYARLCQFFSEEKGYAWPGQDKLAACLGVKDRQIRTYLSELEHVALIATQQVGLTQSSQYRFPRHPWMTTAGLEWQYTAGQERHKTAGQERQYTATKENQLRESVQENHPKGSTFVGSPPIDEHGKPLKHISEVPEIIKGIREILDKNTGVPKTDEQQRREELHQQARSLGVKGKPG